MDRGRSAHGGNLTFTPDGKHLFRWSMGEDGVLTFLAQVGDQIRRYRVTPGTGSVDAMLARATAVK